MKARKDVIVTIAPTSRGFGYAIFATPASLVDWGVKETRRDKNRLARSKGRSDDTGGEAWCRRDRELVPRKLSALRACARTPFRYCGRGPQGGATARVYSRRHIREAFGELGKTKDTIAKAIADSLPALKPWLPPKRRIWESEHYSMAIFEAAALGVTHYRTTNPSSPWR